MTHCRSVGEKWRPCWIEGSATFTIVASRMTMNWAMQTTTSTSQRLEETRGEPEYILRNVLSSGAATSLTRRSGGGSHIRLTADVRIAGCDHDLGPGQLCSPSN